MSIQVLTNYFIEYGAFFIFLIVLLEYLNLPGFPAGVIMPLAGICGSGTCRELGIVYARKAWRTESYESLFSEISKTAAGD